MCAHLALSLGATPHRLVMSHDVMVISPHAPLQEMALCARESGFGLKPVAEDNRKMSEHQVRRLPIVNSEKRLVGIVSLGDFAVEGHDIRAAADALTDISRP